MRELLVQTVQAVSADPKAAHTAGGATTLAGLGTVFDVLPVVFGIVASVLGSILTIVLIVISLKKWKLEKQIMEQRLDLATKGTKGKSQ